DLDATPGPDLYLKEYSYRDPYYDTYDKTFRGFSRATSVEVGDLSAPDQVSVLHFHTGGPDGVDNDDDGSLDEIGPDGIREEHPLTGKLWKTEVADQNGTLFNVSEGTWRLKTLLTGADGLEVQLPHVPEIHRTIHEGTGTPETVTTTTQVDDFGNVVEEKKLGASSIDGDERFTFSTFINDTDRWLLGLPETVTLTDGNLEKVSEHRFHYDGPDYEGLALGQADRGNLTRKESWIRDADWLNAERYAYDAYGNRIGIKNERGFLRSIAYDAEFHQFPTSETIEVGDGKPDLAVSAQFIPGFGQLSQYVDFNDYVSDFNYDSFGRLTRIVRPGDSLALPTEAYRYTMTDPSGGRTYSYDHQGALTLSTGAAGPSSVKVRKREVSGESGTLDSLQYVDGLGRKLALYAEDDDGFIVNEAVLFNRKGKPRYRFLPYSVAGETFQAPDTGLPHSKLAYDAVSRVVEAVNPETENGSTSATTEYLPLRTHTVNEENQLKTVVKDGLDRIVEVEENNQGETYHTRYQYDVLGNLSRITDAQNNVKRMQYDGLGRKIWMNDPDMGIKTYQYDPSGNLVETVDAKNQVVRYTYDGVNRRLSEDYLDTADATPDVLYVYDTHGSDYPTTTFLKGRPSYIRDLSGATFFSYDVHGRVVWNVKRIVHGGETRDYLQQASYDTLGRPV
ncbi:MAG: hypothetical protein GY842_14320, partial [bacterium]|nr:hypothetical protein [bacterium]